MNRDQVNQLAQLALSTKDPDLLAKAVQELMATKQAEALPLFQPQPAIHEAGISAASLAAALDNLPPVLERVVPKATPDPVLPIDKPVPSPAKLAQLACIEWEKTHGDRWMSNTEAFGANMHGSARDLRDLVLHLAESNADMSQMAIGRRFWQRMATLQPSGWNIQHRARTCAGGYVVKEHRIIRTGGQA